MLRLADSPSARAVGAPTPPPINARSCTKDVQVPALLHASAIVTLRAYGESTASAVKVDGSKTSPSNRGPCGGEESGGLAVSGTDPPYSGDPEGLRDDCEVKDNYWAENLVCTPYHPEMTGVNNQFSDDLVPVATGRVSARRAEGGGLPPAVLTCSEPSTTGLCTKLGCFFTAFRAQLEAKGQCQCVVCGTRSSRGWSYGGYRQ